MDKIIHKQSFDPDDLPQEHLNSSVAKHLYPMLFTKEHGGFTISFPDLPNLSVHDALIEVAFNTARSVTYHYLQSLLNNKVNLPKGSTVISIKPKPNEFVTAFMFDSKMPASYYTETLVLPGWFKEFTAKEHVNMTRALNKERIRHPDELF